MSSNEFLNATPDVGQLADAVTALLESCLTRLSDDEVIAAMQGVETCTRQLVVVSRQLTIEAAERKLPEHYSAGSIKKFLIETLRLSAADAGARQKAAFDLGARHDLAGEALDPVYPLLAQAQTEGAVSVDHARAVITALTRIPAGCSTADREAAEHDLVAHARIGWPEDITKLGDHMLTFLDPDGKNTTTTDRARMRGITLGRARPNGMRTIKGEITDEFSTLLDPFLAKTARPGMNNPDDPDSPRDPNLDTDQLRAAADRDHRSPAQRNHDALLGLLEPGFTPDGLGQHRGLPVTTILTMTIDQVEEAAGVVTTATGGTVPISTALKLAERSRPYLAVFDHSGMPLHLGDTERLASAAQRLALTAWIRGCSRPGCDAPASMCAVHHVTEWSHGGPTDLTNETLACDHCHALVHDGPGGWKTVVLGKDSKYPGRTGWIAPHHIDPTRTPRVNHRHHAGEMLARALHARHAPPRR